MKAEKFSKIITAVILVFTAILFASFAINGKQTVPENPLGELADFLEAEILYGENAENDISGEGKTDEEEQEEEPQEPEEYERLEKEDVKQKAEEEKAPGDAFGNGEGEGEGEIDGEVEIVTDLSDMIVTDSELIDDEFNFCAYLENAGKENELKVSFRNSKTNGEYLKASGNVYSKKLTLGANYITLYLKENGDIISSVQYVITYVAEKAGAGNENVGDNPPSIVTNLDGVTNTLQNKNFTFHVTAKTGGGKTIYSDHIEVTLDGGAVGSPTGSSTFEYLLDFGESGKHIVTVTAWDDEGNSAYREYDVNFKKANDGENIGKANVYVDATTVGLDIIGSTECEIIQGESAADTIVRAIEEMGFSAIYSGKTNSGFYLQGIAIGGDASSASVPEELWNLIVGDDMPITAPPSGNAICEYDFTASSGWMYSINGTLYPGKGLSEYSLNDGDSITLRFTLAYGKDISRSVTGYGGIGGYCGVWIDGACIEIPGNHDYMEVSRLEPTSDTDGYIEYMCSKCGRTYFEELPATEGEDVEEHEHDYYAVGVDDDGRTIYYCDCGDMYYE